MAEGTSRIVIQERDLQILVEIAESPACTRQHIAVAYFDGRYEGAKKRLQQLSHAGFIENNDTSSIGRTILRVTKSGYERLADEGVAFSLENAVPLPPRLFHHERMLADCRVALKTAAGKFEAQSFEFHTAADKTSFSIPCDEHWCTETVRPDAICIVRSSAPPQFHFFYLEIDRSTETQSHLIHLARQYQTHQKAGAFRDYASAFRVLFIAKSRERILRTGRSLRQFAHIGALIWMAEVNDVLRDPFGPIWLCPLDFESDPNPVLYRPLL